MLKNDKHMAVSACTKTALQKIISGHRQVHDEDFVVVEKSVEKGHALSRFLTNEAIYKLQA